MKKLVSSMVLSFIVMSCYANFHSQFTEVKGGLNVSTLDGGGQAATYLRYTAWGVSDLQALTSDNRTFELKPNINNYADATTPEAIAEWRNGLDGNRWLGAITFWERVLDGRETGASFTYSVDQWNNLNSRYSTLAFIQVIDPLDDYKVLFSLRSDEAIISTSATGSDITLSLNFGSSTYADKILQAGFSMEGINANPDTDWGSITVTAKDAVVNIEDNTPPTPNPMLFHEVPTDISDNEITMTASNALDNAYGLEYYFICDTDRDLDSGWQSSPYYKNTGLAPGTTHSYRVTCRDTSPNQNVTMPSVSFSATTLANDADAPLPNPAEVAGVSSMFNSVTLTAVEATDASAVEYNFTSVVGGGHSSGWQSSPVYTDNGLLPGTAYDYTVQARDLSASTNITAVSEVVSVITASEVPNLVLAPNGDFENGGYGWGNAEPDDIILSYEPTGGSGDNGGYAMHGRVPGTGWAVLVNPSISAADGGGLELASLALKAGQTVTFSMDYRTISGTAAPALKIDFVSGNSVTSSTGEQTAPYSTEWATHTFDWQIPAGTEKLIFVPVAGESSTHGYDNVGVYPTYPDPAQLNQAVAAEDGSFCFEWTGLENEIYTIQYKENLTDAGWYSQVVTNAVGPVKISLELGMDQVFYRIISH